MHVIGEHCLKQGTPKFTFAEVEAMRQNIVVNAYKKVHLEKTLRSVPRAERRALRAYVAGKRRD